MPRVLATLAAISSHEWDILVSGRFDGFLWSGAESAQASTPTSHPPSRNTTPYSGVSASPSVTASIRTGGASPGFRAPVQLDEDTEIAVLAEVEREIFAGMDALEDAFEALHASAETVRAALRARAGGLAMSASQRRGSVDVGPEVRGWSDTPGSTTNQQWFGSGMGMWDGVMDDGVDLRSELAPDDSASNISSRRRRKRVDRKDVRTPLTVAEEEDD